MDRGSTPRTSTIAAARHHLQHSADPCGVFAYVPASALPLAKSRFAPPLEDCAFRLASALAPSRELCSRGGFAAKSGAHLAPFLRVSHFGRVRCSTLPRSRTEKDANRIPSLRLGHLSLLLRSRSVRPRTTPIRSILRHDERFSAVRSFAASTAALVEHFDTCLRQSPKYFAAANEHFHKLCSCLPNNSGISRHEGQALKMILPRNISFHNSFGNTTFPVIAFRRAASCSA